MDKYTNLSKQHNMYMYRVYEHTCISTMYVPSLSSVVAALSFISSTIKEQWHTRSHTSSFNHLTATKDAQLKT